MQLPESNSIFSTLILGTTDKTNKAAEEVDKEDEEEGYSDNFEDARSPEELSIEHTEEPARPLAPVCIQFTTVTGVQRMYHSLPFFLWGGYGYTWAN